jgi:hypothetical protein
MAAVVSGLQAGAAFQLCSAIHHNHRACSATPSSNSRQFTLLAAGEGIRLQRYGAAGAPMNVNWPQYRPQAQRSATWWKWNANANAMGVV